MSNDAISTIALGVETKSGKDHLNDLRTAFAELKKEMNEFNQAKSSTSDSSAFTTLSAELKRTKTELASVKNELEALAKAQADAAQKGAAAATSAIQSRVRSEKQAAAELLANEKKLTNDIAQEHAKRYAMSQSHKVDGVSYSFKQHSNENDFQAAAKAAEEARVSLLQQKRDYELHLVSQREALAAHRAAVKAQKDADIAAERVKQLEQNQQYQEFLIRQREALAKHNAAVKAQREADKAAERLKGIEQSRDYEMYLQREREALAAQKAAEKAAREAERADKRLKQIEENRDYQMFLQRQREALEAHKAADKAARAAEKEAQRLKHLEQEQQYREHLLREKAALEKHLEDERQLILNNNFRTASLRSQANTLQRAKGLADSGREDLAKSLYGAEAVANIGRLPEVLAKVEAGVNKNSVATKDHTKTVQHWNHAMNDAHSMARGLAGGLGQLWLTWGNVIPLVAGAAVTGSMAKVYTAGKEVEFQLQFLRALASDLEKQPIELDNFLKITDGSMSSVKEAAEGMRALAQAGLDQQRALRALPDILDLAAIGEMTVGQAALTATGTVDAFGLKIEDVARVTDVFSKIASASNTSVEAMTESMKQASTVGEQFGLSIEEAAATMGVLAQRNITGSSAGTSLTNALKSLYEPTDRAAKALKQLGISTDDGAGGLKTYTQLMEELSIKMKGMNDSSKAVFLGTISDQRGAKTLSAITADFDSYKRMLFEAGNASHFASDAVLELQDTVEGANRRIKNSMESSFIKAFNAASPSIREVQVELNRIAKSEEVVSALTRLSIAAANATSTIARNIGTIGTAIGIYAGLRIVSSISNGYLVWRTNTLLATAATAANTGVAVSNTAALTAAGVAAELASTRMGRLAAMTRLASTAFGPISIAIGVLYAAYEIWNSRLDENDNKIKRANNTVNTTLDNYDRQIEKLKELNKQLRESGTNAEKSASQTAKATLEAALAVQNQRVLDLQAKEPKPRLTMSSAGKLVNNMPAGAGMSNDLREAIAARDATQSQLQELNRKVIQLSDERSENLLLRGKKAVGDKLEELLNRAGGGDIPTEDTAKNKELIDRIRGLQERLERGDDGTYLHLRNEIPALEKALNKGKSSFVPTDDRALADMYRAKQAEQDGILQSIKNNEKSALDSLASKNKRGEISDLEMIAERLRIVKQAREDELVVFKRKEELASEQEKRRKDEQVIKNKTADTEYQKKDAERVAGESRLEIMTKYGQDSLKVEAETLRRRGELVGAYLAENADKYKRDMDNIAGALRLPDLSDEDRQILEKRQQTLMAANDTGILSASFDELKAQYDDLVSEMQLKIEEVQEKSRSTNGFLSDVDAAAAADAIRAQMLPALEELLSKMGGTANALGDNKLKADISKIGRDLAKEADRSAQAWQQAGKSIEQSLTSAFGKGGKAVGGLISALMKQKAQQKEIDDQLKKDVKKDPLKQIELEDKAREQSAQLQISTMGDIAGAAKGFFDEQSKGYKALQAAEQAYRAFEMAMAFESFISKQTWLLEFLGVKAATAAGEVDIDTAMTDAEVINAGVRAAADGQAAIAKSASSVPFPANMAAMAATAAALLAIGVAVRGGGGGSGPSLSESRQKYNGTGMAFDGLNGNNTPFDWEISKSESLGKSIEILSENSDIALEHSSGMLSALRTIRDNISGLSMMVARTAGIRGTRADVNGLDLGTKLGGIASIFGSGGLGSFMGSIFGKTTRSLADSGIVFHYTNDYKQTIGSVRESGLNIQSYNDIETTKKNLFSKKTSISSQYSDLPADVVDSFNRTINSMYDAVVLGGKGLGRDTAAIQNDVNSVELMKDGGLLKLSLKGLKPSEVAEELEAAFSALGDAMAKKALPGLEDFMKTDETYLTTLVRVASGVEAAQYALERLNLTAIDYKDITNKQGDVTAELVRDSLLVKEGLSGVGRMMKTLDGSAEELVSTYTDLVLIRRNLTTLGMGPDVTREMVRGAGGVDQLKGGVEDFIDNFFTEAEQNAIRVNNLRKEFDAINKQMPASKEGFKALAKTMSQDTTPEGQRLYGVLLSLSGEFADLADEKGAVSGVLATQRQAVNDLIKSAERWMQTARNAKDLLRDIDSELKQNDSTDQRIAELWALMGADTIDLDQQIELAGELKDLILEKYQVEKDNAKELIDFGKDLRKYVQDLKTGDLSPLTTKQKLEEAGKQYEDILARAASGDEDARGQVQDKADTFLTLARTYFSSGAQYTEIFNRVTKELGDLGTASLTSGQSMEAISNNQLTELTTLRTLTKSMFDKAQEEYSFNKAQLGKELKALEDMSAALDVLSGVPELLRDMPAELAAAMAGSGVGGRTAQNEIETLYQTVLNRHSEQAGLNFWTEKYKQGTSLSEIRNAFYNSDEYLARINGSHASGLDYVPFDGYVAELHRGERVLTAAEARRTDKSDVGAGGAFSTSQIEELKAEIRALRGEVTKLREEQENQTGRIVTSHYQANDAAADKVVQGTKEAAQESAWREKSKPSYA